MGDAGTLDSISIYAERISLSADWYEGLDGLARLRADWLALTADASLFARYEWHLAAATHLTGKDHRIWFCRVGDGAGRPMAIIPAVATMAQFRILRRLPALTLGWSDQLATVDFPLDQYADVRQVALAMLKAFRRLKVDWQVITWPRVMANSNAARISAALSPWLTDITPSSLCSTLSTAAPADPSAGFDRSVIKSTKLRRTLAQHSRRLCEQGPVQMRLARNDGDVEAFFNEFLRIESSGWKGEKGTGTAIALVPAARAFYSSLLAQSNPDFETDIALLYCGNKAVAGQFLIRTGRWEYVYKIGYDEEFAKCSPGQLLLQFEVERAMASGAIDRVSLVTGRDWMKKWEPIQEHTLAINIFRYTWCALIVHAGRFLMTHFRKAQWSALAQQVIEIVLHRHQSMQPAAREAQ